jgi:hypothetical protein
MDAKQAVLQELDHLPADRLWEVLHFVRFLRWERDQEGFETAMLSEHLLQRDWLRPEEDEAWRDL